MPEQIALSLTEISVNGSKAVTLGKTKILIVRTEDTADGAPAVAALEAECPHAKAPLDKGAICNGRLVCPWHTGTFEIHTGALLEPPPLRSLKRYPVRVAGNDILVDATPITPPQQSSVGADKHLVFVGAGAATASALAHLRDCNFAGRITVVDPVVDEPVDRTQLSKMALSGEVLLNKLPLFADSQGEGESLAPLRIDRLQASVVRFSLPDRQLELSQGAPLSFDGLLLATGGVPKKPSIDGVDLPHVFTLRHPEDLQRIEPLLKQGARIALVGDGFIALEAASALRQRGLAVHILSKSKLPLEDAFGAEAATALLNLHKQNGVQIHPETSVTRISRVAVTLDIGADVPADVVLLAIGVEPATGYAAELPRDRKGGFAVAKNLQLAPGIWCAGDVASVEGVRLEHWRVAQQHGRTVGRAMLDEVAPKSGGAPAKEHDVPFFWTFHFGKRLGYAGHADKWDRIEFAGSPESLNFMAFYLQGDRVRGALACGRDTALAALMEPLRGSLSLAEAKRISEAAGQ